MPLQHMGNTLTSTMEHTSRTTPKHYAKALLVWSVGKAAPHHKLPRRVLLGSAPYGTVPLETADANAEFLRRGSGVVLNPPVRAHGAASTEGAMTSLLCIWPQLPGGGRRGASLRLHNVSTRLSIFVSFAGGYRTSQTDSAGQQNQQSTHRSLHNMSTFTLHDYPCHAHPRRRIRPESGRIKPTSTKTHASRWALPPLHSTRSAT